MLERPFEADRFSLSIYIVCVCVVQALRLHETVRKAEEELSAKYTSLIDTLHKDNLDALGRQVATDLPSIIHTQRRESIDTKHKTHAQAD